MKTNLAADLERLNQLTFKRQKSIGKLLEHVNRLLEDDQYQRDHGRLILLKAWLLSPYSLWAGDFKGFGGYVCQQLETVKQLDEQIVAIFESLKRLPSDEAQEIVAENERMVATGDYDKFMSKTAKAKYELAEKELLATIAWTMRWESLKGRYDLSKYRDSATGMIRRRMMQERNFRPREWYFYADDPDAMFWLEFDCLCYDFQLYGVEGDKPLLQKLSVNPTAHGLMIFIPAYWSFDARRDLDWKAINELQKARGLLRQGPKLSVKRAGMYKLARLVYQAAVEAEKLGLVGDKREDYMLKYANLEAGFDDGTLRRLERMGEELLAGETPQVDGKTKG